MNIERAKAIDGWMEEPELEWLADQASKHINIAEIGSWLGRSTRALADNSYGTVYAVDAWDMSIVYPEMQDLVKEKDPDWVYNQFLDNMIGTRAAVIPLQYLSLDAAKLFRNTTKNFDMIFIDASHETEDVMADIQAWMPFLSLGGLLCGHDFSWERVSRAVLEILPNAKAVSGGNIWQVGAK